MAIDEVKWFPLFEFQNYNYFSVVMVPDLKTSEVLPPAPIAARKWGMGTFICGQAFQTADGYTLEGRLAIKPGVEMTVSAHGNLGNANEPASFEAVGTGAAGPIAGAIYQLAGWVFPESVDGGAGKVLSVRGSIRAVRGPDANPTIELGGMPLETVGIFEINRST
jgi:hypothetical protein